MFTAMTVSAASVAVAPVAPAAVPAPAAKTGTILAIDLGKFHSQACHFRVGDGTHEFRRVATTPAAMHELLVARPVDRVVVEAGAQAGWVADLCRTLGVAVLVANANDDAWRWRSVKNKSDREDALKLARLCVMNQLSGVHVPLKAVRQWRSLIQYRHTLVERRTATRNAIHALLAVQGDQAAIKGWSAAMVEELKKLAKPLKDCGMDELWRGQLDLELTAMEQVGALIAAAEARLDELAAANGERGKRVQLLRTIPGVGPRMAELVVAWVDDPRRFTTGRDVGAYAGLTPRRHQSGEVDRHGRISKAGCGRLRKVAVQVAWGMLQHNERGRASFERICKGQRTRRKQAAVALARKVLVWCWAMLRDGKPWREADHLRPAQQASAA
jgi:transposase